MEELDLDQLKTRYFSDPERMMTIRKGETLMEQHQHNESLYLVLEGCMQGFLPEIGLTQYPVFESGPDRFVGVYSFFAKEHRSYTKVVAKVDTKLAYFTRQNRDISDAEFRRYVSFFTAIILNELADRQKFARRIAKERHDDFQKIMRVEKMATLGQMAAGLAHELNNAVGVIKSNSEWLAQQIRIFMEKNEEKMLPVFLEGFEKGQFLSSADARAYRKQLEEKLKIPSTLMKRLARTGLAPEVIMRHSDGTPDSITRLLDVWDIGSNLHDMGVAVNHSSHVVQSVKSLGISRQVWIDDVDVSGTINEALTILKGVLKNVHVDLHLPDLPTIYGCPGELIQVWINLAKNAAESMLGSNTKDPRLTIRGAEVPGGIGIAISDNGPGIPKSIQEKIFEPSFTTKVSGLSFGLGLGLSIVDRIVSDHNGNIAVTSSPGNTTFTITLPIKP